MLSEFIYGRNVVDNGMSSYLVYLDVQDFLALYTLAKVRPVFLVLLFINDFFTLREFSTSTALLIYGN